MALMISRILWGHLSTFVGICLGSILVLHSPIAIIMINVTGTSAYGKMNVWIRFLCHNHSSPPPHLPSLISALLASEPSTNQRMHDDASWLPFKRPRFHTSPINLAIMTLRPVIMEWPWHVTTLYTPHPSPRRTPAER